MRLLLPTERVGEAVGPDDGEAALRELYAYPGGRWLRANMVSTLDGAATGPDGLSGSLSTVADKRVFSVLRTLADAVLVGAGTVRAERYAPEAPPPELAARRAREGRPAAAPFAVVTRSGDVPGDTGLFDSSLRDAGHGTVVVTCSAAGEPALARLRDLAGADHVIVAGAGSVDISTALDVLVERGLRHVLCEGGPTLLAGVVAAGALDELCLTWSPVLGGGPGRVLPPGAAEGIGLRPASLLHDEQTLIGRWFIDRP